MQWIFLYTNQKYQLVYLLSQAGGRGGFVVDRVANHQPQNLTAC